MKFNYNMGKDKKRPEKLEYIYSNDERMTILPSDRTYKFILSHDKKISIAPLHENFDDYYDSVYIIENNSYAFYDKEGDMCTKHFMKNNDIDQMIDGFKV